MGNKLKRILEKRVENYLDLIGGLISVSMFGLLTVMSFCIELPIFFAEIQTLSLYPFRQEPCIGTALLIIWPLLGYPLVVIGAASFFASGLWFLHKAYQSDNWYQNSELKEKVLEVEDEGQNEKPIKPHKGIYLEGA